MIGYLMVEIQVNDTKNKQIIIHVINTFWYIHNLPSRHIDTK